MARAHGAPWPRRSDVVGPRSRRSGDPPQGRRHQGACRQADQVRQGRRRLRKRRARAGQHPRPQARALGGMLRARGQNEAAAIEYEKALTGGPSRSSPAKLARTLIELGGSTARSSSRPTGRRRRSHAVAAVTLGMHDLRAINGRGNHRLRKSARRESVRFNHALRTGGGIYSDERSASGP